MKNGAGGHGVSRLPEVPVIETDRLRLRGHRVDDFEHVRAMWGNSEVTRYIGGRPHSTEESWSRLLRYAGLWTVLGFGYWVVEEKATQEFVGEVGFAEYKREMHPPLGDTPELGWALIPAKQGLGYATEAVNATLRWASEHFGAGEAACLIDPHHQASIRVATKCGFEQRRVVTYKGTQVIVFGRAL